MSTGVLAVIQARMGASRLPGKILADIAGKPALAHVVERVAACRLVDRILVAMPEGKADDQAADVARSLGADVFRGAMDDVLDRYYRAASLSRPEVVVRVTADCPLLDPDLTGRVIEILRDGGFDYASSALIPSFPDGLDVEAMTFATLETAWREARSMPDREHVTPYVRTRPERFRQAALVRNEDISHLCWALDTEDDLAFQRAVHDRLDPADHAHLRYGAVLSILRAEPELALINRSSVRDVKLLVEVPGIHRPDTRLVAIHPWSEPE